MVIEIRQNDVDRCNLFTNLYQNAESISDITVKVEDKVFKLHKAILWAQSGYFRTMFSTPMKENQENIVVLGDVNSIVFSKLVEYMYCGKVDLEQVFALIPAAQRFDINLQQEAIIALKASLTVELLPTIWASAIASKLDQLDHYCFDFAERHPTTCFKKGSSGWNASLLEHFISKNANSLLTLSPIEIFRGK
jgi:hypothetical protein